MQIGAIIKEYRKIKNMTQEDMANRLGVSTPAVNKWEKGVSQPDIMLLAPIARLLDITLDTLLSFREELTVEEINSIITKIYEKLKTATYEEAFQFAKKNIEKYPNCVQLILQVANILDIERLTNDSPNSEYYENCIKDYYVQVLEGKDDNMKKTAADALFGFYLRKEEYEKAEKYLEYFSMENPEKKRKQALICSKTNRIHEAYKAYEELLLSGYHMMSLIFHSIFRLTMEDGNKEKAHMLIEKQAHLAKLFDMGKYNEVSHRLDLATAEKDIEATVDTMEKLLTNIDTLYDFTKSSLYEHMEFKDIEQGFIEEIRENLLDCLKDDETYDYMKENEHWKKLNKMKVLKKSNL